MVDKLTKKQKKANEFRGKKRKLDESIADVPEEDTTTNDADTKQKESKKPKSSKKDAKENTAKSGQDEANTSDAEAASGKKKRRRGKGDSKQDDKAETAEKSQDEGASPAEKTAPKTNQKFIVFVGNLPYNITKEQLEKHFASCGQISSIRVQTDKATGKGKGFAFMEFSDVDSMQKALFFNKTLIKERPINVELTAGGGGNKSAARKQKIAQKNEALNEERRKLHEKHIAPAKELKSSYANSNPPEKKAAPVKAIKKPSEISGANSIAVDGLAARLRKA